MVTRETKIDFINKCLRQNGKRITKTRLRNLSDESIDEICEKFKDTFKKYLENPPVKLIKYYADCYDKENNLVTFEGKFASEKDFENDLVKDGYKLNRIVLTKGHHLCQYCGGIALGTDKDILCAECHEIFGHMLFSEL